MNNVISLVDFKNKKKAQETKQNHLDFSNDSPDIQERLQRISILISSINEKMSKLNEINNKK